MSRGGTRKGAGRPKSQEPTRVVRLPVSIIERIDQITDQNYTIPLYSSKVSAGFPSPAEDYIAERLDLNEYLIKHPSSTFLVRANGNSMINAGIHENDILIVDRSIKPVPGKIIIAAIDGQLTVKRLAQKNNRYLLLAENPDYPPIEILEGQETFIWGVVTQVLHAV